MQKPQHEVTVSRSAVETTEGIIILLHIVAIVAIDVIDVIGVIGVSIYII